MDPESILEAHLLKLVSKMKFARLILPFGIYLINNFQEVYKTLLRYLFTLIYKTNLRAVIPKATKPCQKLLIYVRKQF